MQKYIKYSIFIFILSASIFTGARSTYASTITVNSLLDNGPGNCDTTCTFRDAVAVSQSGDTINFSVTGTITTASYIRVYHNLTITGPGASLLTLDGNDNHTILVTNDPVTLSISNLTFANGLNDWDSAGAVQFYGGQITISNCVFSNNDGNGYAGVMYIDDTDLIIIDSSFTGNTGDRGVMDARGTSSVSITGSTFTNNLASVDAGGVISFSASGNLEITNSTFKGNSATSNGGVIFNDGGTVTITNSTFSDNTALSGGVIYNNTGTASAVNSIFSGTDNCYGTITSLGHNIDSGTSCGFANTGDLSSTDPLLSTLADNGGPVNTIALLAGSPAINAGDDVSAPATDARGTARSGVSDIGAYEYVPPADPTCSDGVQNQNETGIDTGGICTPAPTQNTSSGSSASSRAYNLFAMGKTEEAKKIVTEFPNALNEIRNENIKKELSLNIPSLTKLLKRGNVNPPMQVIQLQKILGLKQDGKFGPKTEKAVKEFQTRNNIKSDGIVGPITWKAINSQIQ